MRALLTLSCLLSSIIAAFHAIAAEPAERVFDLAISRGALLTAQPVLRVEKGDVVRLRFTSDAAGELHLHAYRLEARVTAGTTGELKFIARATGRFRIEWHATGTAPRDSGHHSVPLVTLEVRPK